MRVDFDDKSYIECQKSNHPGKILVVISAKDHENPLKRIVNTVELTTEQFKSLISDII